MGTVEDVEVNKTDVHLDSYEASTTGKWEAMFTPIDMEDRAIDMKDFDLTPTADEKAAMEKEPAYGEPVLYYMADGCTGQATVAVGHIATMLVPITNNVDLTFVGGAHIGCKSLYVLADSEYETTADLKDTSISVPNGIGKSDYNITCLLLDADGINPQTDVTLTPVTADACITAMENGEISAALLSDSFAYSMVKDGQLKCVRSLLDEDFADENCCVIAMNRTFVKENPTISKKIVQAVQKAHSYMREDVEEATQMLIDQGWNGGNYEMNVMLNNSLQFGLDQEFTEVSLKDVVSRYVKLGLIESMDNVDEIMDLAWSPVL